MPVRRPCRKLARLRTIALGCSVLSAGMLPASGQTADPPVITVSAPEGFSDLTQDHTLLVDVFFGGVRKGETQVSTSPGAVNFKEPAEVLELLPELTDRQGVEAALAAGSLSANGQLACSKSADPSRCGRLSPEVVGVIFDRDRFRIDIFVNPRFLAVQNSTEDLYLPAPEGGLGIINAIGAVISGQLGATSNYNFQDSLIVGSGARRIRADLSYASELGLGAERLAFELDRPGLRYSAGALWAPGNDIAGRRKLLGASIESQIDTRRDKDEILGSPLVLYLDQRARVDIMRDGRVLTSAIYEAGNQPLETSSLPEGSYDVVLRIEVPGRPIREERRFFTKSRRIPSLGRSDFYAFGGMLLEEFPRGSLSPSGHPYFQGGAARRLSGGWAIEGGVEATDDSASAEIAAIYLMRVAQVRAAAVAGIDGSYGGIVQFSSGGASRLNFNFDLRHIENAAVDDLPPSAAIAPVIATDPFARPGFAGNEGSYSQIGGVVSYSLADIRFLGTIFYRDDQSQGASYSIGPSLEWDVLRKGPFTLTLRGEMTATDRGQSGFAGISLRLLGAHSTLTALGGARSSNIGGDDLGNGPAAAVSGAWNPAMAGADISVGAGFEHQPNQENVILSTDFRHRLGSLAGDFVYSDGVSSAVSQYSVGFQTSFAAGAGALQVAGKTTTDSMIVARVEGARESDRFEVLVNEQVVDNIVGTGSATLALPAYRAYDVRIRPTGEGLLAYDSSPRTVSLYPGTVTRLDWTAAPVTIKFGRLVDPDGKLVAGASITGKGIWSESDDDGYFQVEAPDNVELDVQLRDGRVFTMTLPEGEANSGVARLGPVVCCGEPAMQFGALNPIPGLQSGGSK